MDFGIRYVVAAALEKVEEFWHNIQNRPRYGESYSADVRTAGKRGFILVDNLWI